MHIRNPKWFFIAVIFSVLALAPAASATTYYIAANGSDSNNGTSKSTPWLHAPGMPNCTATCASVTPAAGDKFIFRGGDTWHWSNSAAASYTGGHWAWTWSGSSGNRIYIGVDKTWYSGPSWTRPIMSRDNPLSTSQVSSCAHDDSGGLAQIGISGAYVTLDNFEFVGTCYSQAEKSFGDTTIISRGASYITLENFYIHGWTHTACSATHCDHTDFILTGGHLTGEVISGAVFDGSDSPPNSGFAVYYLSCGTIENSIFRHLSNAIVCRSIASVHDNLFEYINESYDGTTHGNVVEWLGGASLDNFYGPEYFYNNIIRHVNVGVTVWPIVNSSSAFYFYNNIFYDNGNPGNCLEMTQSTSGGTENLYFYNNTLVSGCTIRYHVNTGSAAQCPGGHAYYTNNHFIGYGSPGSLGNVISVDSACSGDVTNTETTDLFQSASTAAAQGYVSSSTGYCANDTTPCAPTASTNGTVGAGTNESSSSTAFGAALNSDTTLGVAYNKTTHVASYPARTPNPRPSSGAWDAGAYEYGSTTATAPQPPTNLTDTVH